MKYIELMDFDDCYDLAKYLNETHIGSYTEKEIAHNAYEYFSEIKASKMRFMMSQDVTDVVSFLLDELDADGNHSEESEYFAMLIRKEIGLIQPIKYPCRKCKYNNCCGSMDRTEPCKGREEN